ncbi:alginate lyase [Granulicella sp. 5B5]|uniref:alginate lyase family protein n=1 Tax=Granulicella sp. 5B5 TaxID=1617967 RepID=UPI0015F53F62|nr:alginate lyase family protein [Granulicella sp. 5B5]QMV18810.1 alginate lyase [Granulicella sp. 5B5]
MPNPSQNIDRRRFLTISTAAALAARSTFAQPAKSALADAYAMVAAADHDRILRHAGYWLNQPPQTITSFPTPKSPGTIHDYFSEADYFWPNPANPTGPYKEIDGKSNPANFQDHRRALIRLSQCVPSLTAAWRLTRQEQYVKAAAAHLLAWFVTPATRMNPNLQYSQGFHNGPTGRSYGIIDTLHLVEVARSAAILSDYLPPMQWTPLLAWFHEYLGWMKTSAFGIKERDATNNHGICWGLQAAEFARLLNDEDTRAEVRDRFINIQLPGQMAPNGGFPRELARTKPYGYSIFNFDAASTLCWSLSSLDEKHLSYTGPANAAPVEATPATVDPGALIRYTLPTGQSVCQAAAFLEPYLADKSTWPYPHDVQHWDSWPVRSPGLLFCGLACDKANYLALWKRLDPDPTDPEVIRNYPIRQPILWV